jgi:hypothetical protein
MKDFEIKYPLTERDLLYADQDFQEFDKLHEPDKTENVMLLKALVKVAFINGYVSGTKTQQMSLCTQPRLYIENILEQFGKWAKTTWFNPKEEGGLYHLTLPTLKPFAQSAVAEMEEELKKKFQNLKDESNSE